MKPPTYAERMEIDNLINPELYRNVVDFHLFLQEEVADTLLTFAKVIKEATNNKKLVIAFYGYGFELAGSNQSCASSGHYCVRKLLNSKYIDILSSPISYSDRGKGGTKKRMSASESCTLANKVWCDEDDNRTYLVWTSGSPLPAVDKNQQTQKDSIDVMRRNVSQEIICNHTSWWMDLFGAGWYEDPEIWAQVDVVKKAEIDTIKNPKKFEPDVALIYDETSMCHVGPKSHFFAGPLLGASRNRMNQIAVPYGQYLLDDILEKRATPKLNAYLCCFALDAAQREKMRNAAQNSASIFAHSVGIVDLDKNKFSLEAVEQATGFKVKYAQKGISVRIVPTEEGKKAGIEPYGNPHHIVNPMLEVVPQKGDVVLGTYTNGAPALVMRMNGKYPQFFSGANSVSDKVFKYACQKAGVHSYTDKEAAVFANGAYVSLTAVQDGIYTVDLKTNETVYYVFTDKPIGKGPVFKFDLKKGGVKFFRIGQGNK